MQLVTIGKLRKAFGVKGHIKLEVSAQYEDSLASADVIFVSTSEGSIPYFVEAVNYDNVTTIKLEEIDSPESASEISMCSIALRAEDVKHTTATEEGNELLLLAGFELYDKDKSLGTIMEVLEYPQQVMAAVEVDGDPVLVPLVPEFISSIELAERRVVCDLPEGLVQSQL